jgi:hypothetical protein
LNLNKIPEDLAIDLLERSICAVKVAAVLCDAHGIFAWGWNHVGYGYGMHAEMAAISRSNYSRLAYASIYVAALRTRTNSIVTARPCEECMPRIRKYRMRVWWRDKDGVWRNE